MVADIICAMCTKLNINYPHICSSSPSPQILYLGNGCGYVVFIVIAYIQVVINYLTCR